MSASTLMSVMFLMSPDRSALQRALGSFARRFILSFPVCMPPSSEMFSKMLAESLATYRSDCVINHALGQLVKSVSVNDASEVRLDVSEWASGVYLVEGIDGLGCKRLARFIK